MTITYTTCDDCQRSTSGHCSRHPAATTFQTGTAGPLRVVTNQPAFSFTSSTTALCPDLLRYDQIGAADGLRGRVVRGFFWLLRAWPPRR